MKISATILSAILVLAACVFTAAGQSAPVPGKDGWISMFDGKTLNGWKANEQPDS
jgi:hypothetical protein